MKYPAAYSLLYVSGNTNPSQDQIEAFMKACGVAVDKEALAAFLQCMRGRDLTETIEQGTQKLAAFGQRSAEAHIEQPFADAQPAEAVAGGEARVEQEVDVCLTGIFDDDDEY